ncbi:MAG: YceI family protein [Sphingomonadaceae bacterium]
MKPRLSPCGACVRPLSLLLVLLAACSPLRDTAVPPVPTPVPAPMPAPVALPVPAPASIPAVDDPLARLVARGAAQLVIDPDASLIAVTVRRGGAFARFGHDHVVASRRLSGRVDLLRYSTDIEFRLDQMSVDEAGLRQIAGLDTQPDADAIAGTRRNMLVKVLDAEHFPLVRIHAERLAVGQPLQASITLHGVRRTMALPVTLREHNGRLLVDGTLQLRQTDFGLVPYSVMGGALAVQDQLELRFSIVAGPAR